MTSNQHVSVLHREAIEALSIRKDGVYMDATFGRGGHSRSILEALGDNGRLVATDCDSQAVAYARQHFGHDGRFAIKQCNYSELHRVASELELIGVVDGILFDLGVSSPQLDVAERGFSFDRDGPLDMRMDQSSGVPVSEWLANVGEEELATVFREYGEERYAKRIARQVVAELGRRPVTSTVELANIIKEAHPRWEKHKHPATRCFQALRIFINRELDHLRAALEGCVDVLRPGGRIVVISFHSLEDRIVKRFFRGLPEPVTVAAGSNRRQRKLPPRGLPVTANEKVPLLRAIGKAIRPDDEEVRRNPRSRSSVMRVAEKLA
jgi:16S rRNA (cytosine1402-N4)-methyltransferase